MNNIVFSRRNGTALLLLLSLTPLTSAVAQTPFPNGGPQRPVPESAVAQAKRQADGDYGELLRLSVGGQIQAAWDRADETAGVYRTLVCADCTYRVRLRERMVTVIELPEGEKIERADLGDPAAFKVTLRGPRRLSVMPAGFGLDSNMVVHGRSGALYPFYLRAEGFNADTLPDLVVRIEGAVDAPPIIAPAGKTDIQTLELPPPGTSAASDLSDTPAEPLPDDFVETVPFDPDKLRGWGDYELSGSDDLKPETVFRDDVFTYVRFGERWRDLELPTAYVVVDGLDELVNTRVRGTTYIIESTQPLITLKSGTRFLCIRYSGGA
ncbi:hypothetical protein JCM17960_34900 [Magnetospira thiophila]